MTALDYDLVLEQGATFRVGFVWEDPENTPVDLSGWTGRMQMRSSPGSPVHLELSTAPGGGLTLGDAAGTIDVLITAEQSSALPALELVYDLELYVPAGDTYRFARGQVTVSAEVTR